MNPIAVPLTMTDAGAVATDPSTLRDLQEQAIAAVVPDYTADLPGSIIEDNLSTSLGCLITQDQARVDAINSISPYGASPFVLAQLGAERGLAQGIPTNTSVYVVLSGPAGYIIQPGFIVSDGTYQYVVQDGGAIATNGSTNPLYCVANQSGTWAVAANSVTTIVSSVPSGYTITCTNPSTGTPGTAAESVQSYRSRVLAAISATAQGFGDYITSQLQALPGVTPRLVRVVQVSTGWQVICGGGDPYTVAGAIFGGVLDLSTLVGSQISADRNVTATIVNPPNSYDVTFVNPPQQTVTMDVTWNTNLANFTASTQIQQLGSVAISNYINTITVSDYLSEFGAFNAFTQAISGVLPVANLTTFEVAVYINGQLVQPEAGTYVYFGDPESYFYCAANGVTVTQG